MGPSYTLAQARASPAGPSPFAFGYSVVQPAVFRRLGVIYPPWRRSWRKRLRVPTAWTCPVSSNGNSAPFCAAVCSSTGLRACDASRARHPPRLLALVARLPPRRAAREASAERAHRRLQSIAGHRRHDDQSVDAHLGRALDQLGRQRLAGGEGYLERLRPAAELDTQPPELADDRRRADDRAAEAAPPAREAYGVPAPTRT